MKAKKSLVGVAVSLTLLINPLSVSADNIYSVDGIEVFGENSGDNNDAEDTPFREENEDLGPRLIFNIVNESDSSDSKDNSSDTKRKKSKEKTKSNDSATKTEKSSSKTKDSSSEIENDPSEVEEVRIQKPPIESPPPVEENPNVVKTPIDEDNFGDDYENSSRGNKGSILVINDPTNSSNNDRILPPSRINKASNEKPKIKKVHMKKQKPRFVKLMIDDTYTYYLDKQSIAWKRLPYSTSEYMLDVWIRMIRNDDETSDLPEDLSDYINDTNNGEILVATEKRIEFAPIDVEVLSHRNFFLEHYYLRPKTKQSQFLCSLEVVGHPQNVISEHDYDYKNWENLVPSSIEQIIYNATIKEVGKKGSSDRSRMSFADMMDEYARIAIR